MPGSLGRSKDAVCLTGGRARTPAGTRSDDPLALTRVLRRRGPVWRHGLRPEGAAGLPDGGGLSSHNPERGLLLLDGESFRQGLCAAASRDRTCCNRLGTRGSSASRTAARYPPIKIEYITARAQPTPKANPRKNPISAAAEKVTCCRMAHHRAFISPLCDLYGPLEGLQAGFSPGDLDEVRPDGVHSVLLGVV